MDTIGFAFPSIRKCLGTALLGMVNITGHGYFSPTTNQVEAIKLNVEKKVDKKKICCKPKPHKFVLGVLAFLVRGIQVLRTF